MVMVPAADSLEVRKKIVKIPKKDYTSRKKEKPLKIRKEFPETWLWAEEKLE